MASFAGSIDSLRVIRGRPTEVESLIEAELMETAATGAAFDLIGMVMA